MLDKHGPWSQVLNLHSHSGQRDWLVALLGLIVGGLRGFSCICSRSKKYHILSKCLFLFDKRKKKCMEKWEATVALTMNHKISRVTCHSPSIIIIIIIVSAANKMPVKKKNEKYLYFTFVPVIPVVVDCCWPHLHLNCAISAKSREFHSSNYYQLNMKCFI